MHKEFRFWSVVLGCHAVRLSMFDHAGQEYFMVIPFPEGRTYRQKRAEALELIEEAMRLGLDPGEVVPWPN